MSKIDEKVKEAARKMYAEQRLSKASGRSETDACRPCRGTLLVSEQGDVLLYVSGKLVARTLTALSGRACVDIAVIEPSETERRRLNAFLLAFCGYKAVRYRRTWYWSIGGARLALLCGNRRLALPSKSLAELYI